MLKNLKVTDNERTQVRSNLAYLKTYFRNRIYPEWQRGVKAYSMDSTDRMIDDPVCRQVQSDYYLPYTKRQIDNIFNKLYDTQNQYDVHEKGGEDHVCDGEDGEVERNSSSKIEDIIEDAFQTPDNRRDFYTGVKTMIIVGNGYVEARVDDVRGCPEPSVGDVGPFSLYFFTNQDFYDSGLPVVKRSISTLSTIIQELSGYGVDIKDFKKEWNKQKQLRDDRVLEEDAKKKAAKKEGKEYVSTVNQAWDKRDDEKIWEARFHGDFVLKHCKQNKKCHTCNKDECNCPKLPGGKNLMPAGHPLDSIYSYDDNDEMHEYTLYWTRDYLFVIVDDVLVLKFNNPISNPCGEMTMKEKEKLIKMEERIRDMKKGRSKEEKAENMKKKKELEREKERYEELFEVDYFGPYHPYVKIDVDPNSRAEIQMGYGSNGYKEQLLYNSIFNNWMDRYRTIADLSGMFTIGEDQEIVLPNGVQMKDGQMPMMKGLVVKVKGDGPGLRSLGENIQVGAYDLNILNYLDATSDRNAGLTSVTGGTEKGIQRVPGAVDALTQVTAQNLQPLVESMSHSMSRIVKVWQRLMLNYMDKNDIEEVDIRKRRGGKTKLTREDLKKDFHIVVNNKSLTTLQNFSTTIQKINAVGQIQGLLTNPVNGDPFFDFRPIVKDLLHDLDIDCDVELTKNELFNMKKDMIKEQTKLSKLQSRETRKVEFTELTTQQKLQERLQKRAEKRAADLVAGQGNPFGAPEQNNAIGAQPGNAGASQGTPLSPEEIQTISETAGIPIELLQGITQEEIAQLEQQVGSLTQIEQPPLVEQVEGGSIDLGEF